MTPDDWGFDDKSAKTAPAHWADDTGNPNLSGEYRWNWRLTLVVLFVTSACVFLTHFLLRGETNLDAVQVGLLFFVPAAAVLFSSFLLEYQTSLMTPRFSRNGQALVALIASVVVFAVGCLGQISFISFTYRPNNYIFLVDKSDSMGYYSATSINGSDPKNLRQGAFEDILGQLADGTQVGFVLFSDVIIGQYPISPLDTEARAQMLSVLAAYDNGGTDIALSLETALNMLAGAPTLAKNKTHIIILTDGNSQTDLPAADVEAQCRSLNAVVSCVKLGSGAIDSDLQQVISATGGRNVSVSNIGNLTQTLSDVSEGDSRDVIHNGSDSANWIAGLLFVFTGVALGLALSLMLSRSRQFRFQLIFSPLMGGAAFALVKYLRPDIEPWIWTAAAFCLYGLVFMQLLMPSKSAAGQPDSF